MKLISVALARTVLQFELNQVSQGRDLWPVCQELIERYHFAGAPKNALDLDDQKALSFKQGSFVNSKDLSVSVSISIFSNGLVVDALSSTDDTDEFLEEIQQWVAEDFGLVVPPGAGRAYVSQLDVESDFSFVKFHPQVAELAEAMTHMVSTVEGKPRTFDFGVLQFWTEDVNPATSPAIFRFERKIGLPFASNRYFTQAALKTIDHMAFLDALEALAKG
jgi:hypothetical protein